jgi:arylsulfatase A
MSLRTDHYTLIGWLPKKADEIDLKTWMASNDPERFELYDLARDPSQTTDIASQEPERVDSMKKEMTVLWREMRDEGLAVPLTSRQSESSIRQEAQSR